MWSKEILGGILLSIPFLERMFGPPESDLWWTKKTDARAANSRVGLIEKGEHFDLRQLPNFRRATWHQYNSHKEYVGELYHSWVKFIPPAATYVAIAHAIKAQGWGLKGTRSRIPDHCNLGPWASPGQVIGYTSKGTRCTTYNFWVGRDPKIGPQCFKFFSNWDGCIQYYLSWSSGRTRKYLMHNFGHDKDKYDITESQVQAYMRYINRWLSATSNPDAFGAQMYKIINRIRRWY